MHACVWLAMLRAAVWDVCIAECIVQEQEKLEKENGKENVNLRADAAAAAAAAAGTSSGAAGQSSSAREEPDVNQDHLRQVSLRSRSTDGAFVWRS